MADVGVLEVMDLLGLTGQSWDRWRVAVKALNALPLTDAERPIFEHHTGRTRPPSAPPREAYFIVGRRGGKDRIAGMENVHAGAFRDYGSILAPGERAVIGIAAADRDQARISLNYTMAPFEQIPELAALVTRRTRWELEVQTGATIEIRTSHYGRIRGRTFGRFTASEVAFWPSDEQSANPAEEVLTAVRPGLATIPGAQLVVRSTPYARRGALWAAYSRYWGRDDDAVLVWHGTSLEMNPTLDERLIVDALERDESAARAEWLAEFRSDLETFISSAALARVVIPGCQELAPRPGMTYGSFTDPAGGSGLDSFTLGLGHVEEEPDGRIVVLDCVREVRPPFSPEVVVAEFVETLRLYGVTEVIGDHFGGEWPREAFRRHGIEYRVSESSKSEIYASFLPALNSQRVKLLDHPRLLAQLGGLERRVGFGGRDSIDHGPRGHDDLANAAAGVLQLLLAEPGTPRVWSMSAPPTPPPPPATPEEAEAREREEAAAVWGRSAAWRPWR